MGMIPDMAHTLSSHIHFQLCKQIELPGVSSNKWKSTGKELNTYMWVFAMESCEWCMIFTLQQDVCNLNTDSQNWVQNLFIYNVWKLVILNYSHNALGIMLHSWAMLSSTNVNRRLLNKCVILPLKSMKVNLQRDHARILESCGLCLVFLKI